MKCIKTSLFQSRHILIYLMKY